MQFRYSCRLSPKRTTVSVQAPHEKRLWFSAPLSLVAQRRYSDKYNNKGGALCE